VIKFVLLKDSSVT